MPAGLEFPDLYPGVLRFLGAMETCREPMNTSTASTDSELFARIRDGDSAAFGEFYDRHAGLLHGVAFKILQNPTESEEVLQDAFLTLWERAPLWEMGSGPVLGWAVTIVRNRAIDRLRSRQRRADLNEAVARETGDFQESAPDAAAASVAGETAVAVRLALSRLPADQREAIELAFFGGLTQQEIATRLDLPLGTIKARIRRGMLALRDPLEGLT